MRLPAILALLLASAAAPLAAQTDVVKLRVDKLEKEMKAVQRKVFPNGVPVQPEIGTGTTTTSGPVANPVADLTTRLDSFESQLRTLTGQVETNENRLKKLEESVRLMKAEAETKAAEGTTAPAQATTSPTTSVAPAATVSAPASTASSTVVTPPKPAVPVAAKPAVATVSVAAKPATVPAAVAVTKPAVAKPLVGPVAPAKPASTAKPDPARKAAIAAVEIPATGDAIEDAYTYGFRLWSAKLYPEAQVKLREFAAKYPSHKRASYAQNLLGRAYLDEGKPNLASVTFYENYTKNPKGERASESLYWLGVALTRLKKLPDACKVYDEFDEVYGAKSSADLKAKVAKGRADAKCAA